MAVKLRSMRDVVEWRLCAGCGACFAACDRDAVRLVNGVDEGIRPVFDPVCDSCSTCLGICPGVRVDAFAAVGVDAPKEPELGPVLEIWEGYAADPEIRHQGSSGGVLSALAWFSLEHEKMEFALHSGKDPKCPWANRTFQSRTRAEVLARAGSRYAPASPCDGLDAIRKSAGPCVFIGKPCDAAAAIALRKQEAALDRNLGLVLTFFCAGTPSTQGTLAELEHLGVRASEVKSLRYRGQGWPGRFLACFGADGQERSSPYSECWGRLAKFTPLRCRLCPHGLGQIADISCGDAWESYRSDREGEGLSLVLVRTERGREILHRALAGGALALRQVRADAVRAAQGNLLQRQRELFGRLAALRAAGIPTTTYVNFGLRASWAGISLSRKAKSILGTWRRAFVRQWWRRNASNRGRGES
ncbi:MAG: Coenzyme F420 hydrogenase/dehydrogenase, beta subunit C-terminal domain [Candidatus Sumerlaeota bacterium]|nr:Coenzyme F420 hydrogenase/dehydrogenase, beta subunit C-terminal domain [Candidatus Sumerlaeota bacterium]